MLKSFQAKVVIYAGNDAEKYVYIQNTLDRYGIKHFSSYFNSEKYDKSRRGFTQIDSLTYGDEYGNYPPAERTSVQPNGYLIEVRKRDYSKANELIKR